MLVPMQSALEFQVIIFVFLFHMPGLTEVLFKYFLDKIGELSKLS